MEVCSSDAVDVRGDIGGRSMSSEPGLVVSVKEVSARSIGLDPRREDALGQELTDASPDLVNSRLALEPWPCRTCCGPSPTATGQSTRRDRWYRNEPGEENTRSCRCRMINDELGIPQVVPTVLDANAAPL